MRRYGLPSLIILLLSCAGASSGRTDEMLWNCCRPEKGAVPDEQTAVAIAKAVLMPIYHAEFINGEEPFSASLTDAVWTVTGTAPKLPPQKVEKTPSGTRVTVFSGEGPVQVLLAQRDGRLLRCCWPVPHGER